MLYRNLDRDRCSMSTAATATAAALLTVLALLPAATIADGSSQLGMCRMDPAAAHQFCGLPQELSNFQGNHKCDKSVVIGRPRNYSELASLVGAYPRVKAVGVGHSWWAEQFCAGSDNSSINIVMTELQDTLPAFEGKPESAIFLDEAARSVTVKAGVSQRTLLKYLAKRGWTIPAHSWFIDQSIGGAVATGSHGSSLKCGSISSQLLAMKVMLANGTMEDFSAARSPHLWRALQVGVGRAAIILELTFRLVDNADMARTKEDLSFDSWLEQLGELQRGYRELVGRQGAGPQDYWQLLKPWDGVQLFWFVPLRTMWRVQYTRVDNTTDPTVLRNLPFVSQLSGSSRTGLPEAAFRQVAQPVVANLPGMASNAKMWSYMIQGILSPNARPGIFPANEALPAMSDLENKLHAATDSYDQYEVSIPLDLAADCLASLRDKLYGAADLAQGFRSPPLVRFVAGEQAYLSPTSGGPRMYINLEDYVSGATHKVNEQFQEVMHHFRTQCAARLHWGKAGWARHAKCFDGAVEYPDTWCHFGCAVQQLDPGSKFASASNVWRWRATKGGSDVPLEQCCGPEGFNSRACACTPRNAC